MPSVKVAFSAGHSYKCDGVRANGYSEHEEASKITALCMDIARASGVTAYDCTSEAATQSGYLAEQVRFTNATGADVAAQIHFNDASDRSATGVEVFYHTGDAKGREIAERISADIAAITGLKNRGAKATSSLYFINSCWMTAVLVEVCFMGNASDMAKTVGHYDEIAQAIVFGCAEMEYDMASVQDIVNGVFHEPLFDGFPGKPKEAVWGHDGEGTGNGYSQLGNVLRYIYDNTIETKQKLAELEAAVAVSGVQPVKAQPAAAGIDIDALAEAVVAKLADRIKE